MQGQGRFPSENRDDAVAEDAVNLQHDLVLRIATHQTDRACHQLARDEREEEEIYPLMTHRSPLSGMVREKWKRLNVVHLFWSHEFPELDALALDVLAHLSADLQRFPRDASPRHIG